MNPFAKLPRVSQRRRGLIAKVHVAKKMLGLNDDDYRAVLIRLTGHDSAAMLDEEQLEAVVREFEAKGFTTAQPAGVPRPADHPSARKARALWLSLHQLGAVENASEQALEAFARRQLGVAKLQWADQSQCYKLVEALKAIADRHGWSQDLAGIAPHARVIVLKRRLVEALLDKLQAAGLVPADWSIERAAWALGGIRVQPLFATADELDVVAQTFGVKLRQPIAPLQAGEVA